MCKYATAYEGLFFFFLFSLSKYMGRGEGRKYIKGKEKRHG